MRGSAPGWDSLPGLQVQRLLWAGATNAFSVLPVRRCYALQKSRIQPFPFSAVTASKQQHLCAGYPTPPTVLAGAGAALAQFQGQGLGLGLQKPPGASRSCQGRCGEKGSAPGVAGCCRLWSTMKPCPRPRCSGGYTAAPPAPARALPAAAAQPGHQHSLEQLLRGQRPREESHSLLHPYGSHPGCSGEGGEALMELVPSLAGHMSLGRQGRGQALSDRAEATSRPHERCWTLLGFSGFVCLCSM